jgi:hypothetical protein
MDCTIVTESPAMSWVAMYTMQTSTLWWLASLHPSTISWLSSSPFPRPSRATQQTPLPKHWTRRSLQYTLRATDPLNCSSRMELRRQNIVSTRRIRSRTPRSQSTTKACMRVLSTNVAMRSTHIWNGLPPRRRKSFESSTPACAPLLASPSLLYRLEPPHSALDV